MFTRTPDWWTVRRLHQRPGRPGGEQVRVALELDGSLEAYALYRLNFGVHNMVTKTTLEVGEALGTSPRALAAIWRYLLGIDWVARIEASWLPLDHPLLVWLREPRRMAFTVLEAVWVRLVDVGAALSARSLGEGSVVLDVRAQFCPWNQARWSRSRRLGRPDDRGGRSRAGRIRARLGLPRRVHLRPAPARRAHRGGEARRRREGR